jgi:hypothetical protein
MEYNILTAIEHLVSTPIVGLKTFATSANRANSMGEALEEFVKDMFAGTLGETDEAQRLAKIHEVFSFLGNQNNPPDIILKGGDAIEVKKMQKHSSSIALNSSYPKAKLFAGSSMITEACRHCEEWTEKDLIYAVGVVNDSHLSSLCLVYGEDYAASASIYQRIKKVITDGIHSIGDVELAETNELGRVNRVDPLGITFLRIRGMWQIENPVKVFSYVHTSPTDKEFTLMALINTDKYLSFDSQTRADFEKLTQTCPALTMLDVQIKTPDNPARLKNAKLITFYTEGEKS